MIDPSSTRILGPPPCPAPVPETTPAAILAALRTDLLSEAAPLAKAARLPVEQFVSSLAKRYVEGH